MTPIRYSCAASCAVAACRKAKPDELFVRGAEQNRAKLLCHGCPVRTECLADALDNGVEGRFTPID